MKRLLVGVVMLGTIALAPSDALSAPLSDVESVPTPRSQVVEELRLEALVEAALVVGEHLDEPPLRFLGVWAYLSTQRQDVILRAVNQIGKPYRYATSDPDVGFDCSGLTRYVWSRAGVELPTRSTDQLRAFERAEEPTAGDIVGRPGHVMIWTGVDDYVIHAANSRIGVVVSDSRLGKFVDPTG